MRSNIVSTKPKGSESGPDLATMSTCALRVGVQLRSPIYDSRNLLLLARGATITPAVIDRLQQRGVATIRVHRGEMSRLCRQEPGRLASSPVRPAIERKGTLNDRTGRFCPVESRHSGRLDAMVDGGSFPGNPPAGNPIAAEFTKHGIETYDPQLASRLNENYQESLNQMDQLFQKLAASETIEAAAAEAISADNMVRMADDLDLFVSLGITPGVDKYPARHGLQTSMLAMAIGANMGLDKRSSVEMGMGCLVHDAGMMHINRKVFETESALDPMAFVEITKHPILTFDLMRNVDRLPGCTRLVAYQMHERCNGTGYPRRRKGNQIHQLARIATVADVFVALVSPRPHRPGMMPYHAVEHILRGAQKGLFDPLVVRGLLRTVSLFPIGSCIELNDGRVGRVIRSSGAAYTKPIVEVWARGGFDGTPSVIDLSAAADVAIARPLAVLNSAADSRLLDDWD